MAITTSKVTYSLKPETAHRVQELAIQWGVPKSEVIKRAVENLGSGAVKVETPLEILRRIERQGTGLSLAAANKFMKEVRAERRAWGSRRK